MSKTGISEVVEKAIRNYFVTVQREKPTVYLVSAGVSAPLIIDQLHDKIPNSTFIDCGSIWDAFVGIGGQRKWRARLYDSPNQLKRWKRKNLGVYYK